MSWYAIAAVDRALSRTKKALFEPFDFWKWAKLAIIIFLIGGGGSNFGGQGTSYQGGPEDFENNVPYIGPGNDPVHFPDEILNEIPYFTNTSVADLALLTGLIAGFILLVLIFIYISSIMEFVFVESLVKNEVKFWNYSRRFLGKGFYLFLVRLVLGLVFLILFAIFLLPLIMMLFEEAAAFTWPVIFGSFFWFIGITALLALTIAVNSFISLAIPLSIYKNTGILSAFRLVFSNFRKSWREIIVYWLVRFVLGLAVGIATILLFVLLILILGLLFLIIDGILYFIFSSLLSESLSWVPLVPIIIIEFILFLGALLFFGVPFQVFMKYHLLSFLEAWFTNSDIPFFDVSNSKSETLLSVPENNV